MTKPLLLKKKNTYTHLKTLFHCQQQSLAIGPSLSFLSNFSYALPTSLCPRVLNPQFAFLPPLNSFAKVINKRLALKINRTVLYADQQNLALFTTFSSFLEFLKTLHVLIFLTFCSFSVFLCRLLFPASPQTGLSPGLSWLSSLVISPRAILSTLITSVNT